MNKERVMGKGAPRFCFQAWSFRCPIGEVDMKRILAELTEVGAEVAKVKVGEQTMVLVREDKLKHLREYERVPFHVTTSSPHSGFQYDGGRVRLVPFGIPGSGWAECTDTSPQEMVEWIRRAEQKRDARVRAVVQAYKP
jgi:hypothetical protein